LQIFPDLENTFQRLNAKFIFPVTILLFHDYMVVHMRKYGVAECNSQIK